MRLGNWLAMAGIAVATAGMPMVGRMRAVSAAPRAAQTDPNAQCAPCHQAIYEKYRKTPMARASGPAAEGFLPGGLTHAPSGVSYKMVEQDGRVYLRFSRAAASGQVEAADDGSLKGERELRYFLGSGTRGRTYLFEQQGYWFEIPINWYAKKGIWDMAPNYQQAQEMPLTMPVDPPCLRCHSSEAQPSLPEARNKYAGAPFLAGGITCVACHGDAAAHLASEGRAAMMKIDDLPHTRRDSICLSCHLEGQEAVVHAGKRLVDFRPGDNIFDYASFFVRQASAGSDARATSQWEALLQSGCKRGAGEKLTCTSCHDPHGSTSGMSAADRVAFYRAKCLACHDAGALGGTSGSMTARSFAETHHPENPDCASCHMAPVRADDIAHEQVTDHRIPRLPSASSPNAANPAGPLVAVSSEPGVAGASTDRDLGMAYAFAASRGDRQAGERAVALLTRSKSEPGAASDAGLHEQLGFLQQLAGNKDAASSEYAMALAADPHDAIAAGDLALLKAGERQYGAAIALWERAFAEDPVQLKAGMNLAIVQCGLGKKEESLATLARILTFSPDYGQARELMRGIRSGGRACVDPGENH